ncbi:hypothetical protein SAMN05216372_103366 [Pseudomonas straminea]|uniref:Uncharacterized protein n=1 Tax=Pseudomonas straminea TaxID=47882 RepID=A0A1I1UR19_PSEOC|nr:hypothetical protein SAMN05216372_103366 [Pseudomonas straminea]
MTCGKDFPADGLAAMGIALWLYHHATFEIV